MPQDLDQSAAAPTEHEQMPAVRITLERLLHQQRQAIKALAHVGVPSRQPDPRAARGQDHRRRLPFASTFVSADTVEASTGSPADGMVTITPAQLGYLLEGIDWRMPHHTWRPQAAD